MKTNRPRLSTLKPRLATLDTRTVKPPERNWAHRKATEPNMAIYQSPEWRAMLARSITGRLGSAGNLSG